MKLDMIRMPMTGLPSAGTKVTATDGKGRPLSDNEAFAAGETDTVVLHPGEATALLTSAVGRRFERPVRAIVTGPPRWAKDPDDGAAAESVFRFPPQNRGENTKRRRPADPDLRVGPPDLENR